MFSLYWIAKDELKSLARTKLSCSLVVWLQHFAQAAVSKELNVSFRIQIGEISSFFKYEISGRRLNVVDPANINLSL